MSAHTLYRFFDADGRLLYVGRTISPARRWREHEKNSPWFDAVANVTRQVFAAATDVDHAERRAIATEGPLYNIAFNPNASVPTAAALIPMPDEADSLQVRWDAAGITEADVSECPGDYTVCECASCHSRRLVGFENLESWFGFHPTVMAAIDSVKRAYYRGHEIVDWHYDYFDIETFAPGRLRADSQDCPTPAYCRMGDRSAAVDCPFCCGEHRHFLTSGASLDEAIESPCGGRYVLFSDWLDAMDAQYAWGEQVTSEAVA